MAQKEQTGKKEQKKTPKMSLKEKRLAKMEKRASKQY